MDSKNRHRIFLSIFFFLSGFCFSSWTSRIPTIKATFDLNDAELGTVLLCMPVSSLIGLPISGWLVSRYDSRIPLIGAFILNAFSLLMIGWAESIYWLLVSICTFAFSLRMLNIAVNTQALTLQKLYERKINGSFHGLWSTGGIAGVGCCTLLVGFHIDITPHLTLVACFSFITSILCFKYLLKGDRAPTGNKIKIGKPDPFIYYLGLLVFFAAVCEGGMFDWSGVYFREIIKEELFTAGYLIFMTCMALSRFASDRVIETIGMPLTYLASAFIVMSGISIALLFPTFWPAMAGFSLVGIGTGPVIPMTYSLAGTSRNYSAGMVISIIATYGIAGMLIGPPLIGYLSHAFNLRISFITFALSGFMLIPISRLFFRHLKFSS